MYQLIIVIHILLGLGVIGLVLMQQGKGADAGASFGSGSSGSVFGAQGAASFLSRSTAVLATLFFCTSLGLAIINGQKTPAADIMSTPVVKKDATLPEINGAKATDKAVAIPDVKMPVAPAAPAMITPEKPVSVPAMPVAVPAAATSEVKAVETPKVEEKPAEATKPVEVKATEQHKAVESKKPVEKAKPVKDNSHTEKKPAHVEKKPAKDSHAKDEKKK